MKKLHLGIILSVIILLSHQNCQRPPYKDTAVASTNETVQFSTENIQKVTFNSSENVLVQQKQIQQKQNQQAAKTFTLISQNAYEVNFETGVLLKSVQADGTIIKYCLSSAVLGELQDILKSAKVCKSADQPPADRVCTQVYQLGYAQITTSREVIDLGSSSDGCGSNKIDLCDGSGDMLKGWFANAKNQLQNFACPN